MRGEVWKETPKKEMDLFLLTSHGSFFGHFVNVESPQPVLILECMFTCVYIKCYAIYEHYYSCLILSISV